MRLITGAATDVGRVREGNEDGYLVDDAMGLVAVADGMGGHRGGRGRERHRARGAARRRSPSGRPLREAMQDANEAVFTKSLDRRRAPRAWAPRSPRATLVTGGTVLVGHVGDSRAYLLHDGELRQVTIDHSLVEELVREGRLTADEAAVHPQRIDHHARLGVDASVEVDVYPVELAPGDRLLLCSDGLTGMVQADDHRRRRCAARRTRRVRAATLVDAANAAGGEDNITVVVVAVTDDAPLRVVPTGRADRGDGRRGRTRPEPGERRGAVPAASAGCCSGRSRSSSCSGSPWARSAGTRGEATTSTCTRAASPCSRACPAAAVWDPTIERRTAIVADSCVPPTSPR